VSRESVQEKLTTAAGGEAYGAFTELVHATEDGRAPAAAAVRMLAEYFWRWVNDDTGRSFDQILGFTGAKGRGRGPIKSRLQDDLGELFLCHLMGVLCAGGLRESEAAEVVSLAVNRSADSLFQQQCRALRLEPPSDQHTREGQPIEHKPPKSIHKIYDDRGGERWARCAGYFGDDCEERRALPLLERTQESFNFLIALKVCEDFRFRSVADICRGIPLNELPPAIAEKLRDK
jgi:hypothetical protein